jgi:hypothetical protein
MFRCDPNEVDHFAAISPATPGIGITWDRSYLPVDGTLKVVTTGPATISFQTISGGGGINLNWPANQGWILQQTTNLLHSWNDVTTTTNAYQVVPTPTRPDQFYRLRLGP